MRRTTIRRIQHLLLTIGFVSVAAIGIVSARIYGWEGLNVRVPTVDAVSAVSAVSQRFASPSFPDRVVLISGHSGSDSGAICAGEDGSVLLTEADVNAAIAHQVVARFQDSGLIKVDVAEEYDPVLEGLRADLLLSLHADSCIAANGYKAAYHTAIPATEQRLVGCIDLHYSEATGLAPHPDTVTHNMTEYHAFKRIDPSTPAAILEMGFLGGDQALLTDHADKVAMGIADSILCFFDKAGNP